MIIDNINILSYLQTLYINSDRGQPDFILVGAISSEQPKLQVRLNTNKAFLKSIDILYVPGVSYPLLNVRVASNSISSQWTTDRKDWPQKATVEDDLRLSQKSSNLGKIGTRPIELPFPVSGKKLQLTIQDMPSVDFMLTTIMDHKDSPLVLCLKSGAV